jgi:lipopolysaccharide/colanic/teichoic acid biosynthesis glycosyltransferase
VIRACDKLLITAEFGVMERTVAMGRFLKRTMDIVCPLLAAPVWAPLVLLGMLAVRIAMGRPALFRQLRVGRGGKPFLLNKLRSMSMPGDARHCVAGSFDAGHCARVTPLGRRLRQWKLDELPQLWNVLTGEMSLVGPRPEVRKWVEAYPERWAKVLTVRPGITDPASIVYRNEEALLARAADPERAYRDEILPHKLELYENYVDNQSFWGDLAILFRTVWTVLRGR